MLNWFNNPPLNVDTSYQANFQNIKIYFNSSIPISVVEFIRKNYDSEYVPRTNNPYNRTIFDDKTVVQLDINHNICEIILPFKQLLFRNFLMYPIVEFLISLIKQIISYKLSNEIGNKIYFYVPENSPASQEDWWNMKNFSFQKNILRTDETAYGIKLKTFNIRYTLHLHLNDKYQLIKIPDNYNATVPNQCIAYNGFNTNFTF